VLSKTDMTSGFQASRYGWLSAISLLPAGVWLIER